MKMQAVKKNNNKIKYYIYLMPGFSNKDFVFYPYPHPTIPKLRQLKSLLVVTELINSWSF